MTSLLLASHANAIEYFRYKDEGGILVINTYIPPEFVPQGYEVITSTGQVLKVVPPAPTEAELAIRAEQKKQEEAAAREAAAQAEVDERLMKLYSHPDDAKRALERKLAELDYQISRKKGQRLILVNKIEEEQKYAAERERSGRTVREETLQEIEKLQRQIDEFSAQVIEIEEQKKVAEVKFQKDIERMIFLWNEKRKKQAK